MHDSINSSEMGIHHEAPGKRITVNPKVRPRSSSVEEGPKSTTGAIKEYLHNWKHTIALKSMASAYIIFDAIPETADDLSNGNYLQAVARTISGGASYGLASYYGTEMDAKNNSKLAADIKKDNQRLQKTREQLKQ